MRRVADEAVSGENSGKLNNIRTASETMPFCYDMVAGEGGHVDKNRVFENGDEYYLILKPDDGPLTIDNVLILSIEGSNQYYYKVEESGYKDREGHIYWDSEKFDPSYDHWESSKEGWSGDVLKRSDDHLITIAVPEDKTKPITAWTVITQTESTDLIQVTVGCADDPATPNIDETNNTLFTVGNTPGSPLPMTGGVGTGLFTAFGGLMTATAGAILTMTTCRRRKKQFS